MMLFDARRALPQVNRDILDLADYFREHGWCRGAYRIDDDVCPLRALYNLDMGYDREQAVGDLLMLKLGTTINRWNDAPGRTKEEVIAKFEEIGWEVMSCQGSRAVLIG